TCGCAPESPEPANEARMGLAGEVTGGAAGYITEGECRAAIHQCSVTDLRDRKLRVLDVRRKAEHANGHVPGAQHIPLDELPRRAKEVESEGPLAVICASGYRSSIASSLLQREGIASVMNVIGGTSAWIRAGF